VTYIPYMLLVFSSVQRPGLGPLTPRKLYITPRKLYITPPRLESDLLPGVPYSRFDTGIGS
jgi:hypothetical protein